MQTERAVRPEIFRNKRAIFRAIPLFPFQRVGTQIPVLFAQSCFGRQLAPGIFPAISTVCRWALFTGSRSSAFYFFSSHLEKWHMHVRCSDAGRIFTKFFLSQAGKNTKQKEEFCNGRSTKKEISKTLPASLSNTVSKDVVTGEQCKQ